MKSLLAVGREHIGLLSGLRSPPLQCGVPYARDLREEAGVDYEVVISASPRAIDPVVNDPFALLTRNSYLLQDSYFTRSPEAFILTLPEGRIVAHGVATADGRLIGDLSTEGGVRAPNVAAHSLLKRKSLPRSHFLPGRCLSVANDNTVNYYHWMMEAVPRLELLRRYAEQGNREAPLLLNCATTSFQREVLAHLGLLNRTIDTRQGQYQCDTLIAPAEAGVAMLPASWSIQLTRQALKDLPGRSAVSRDSARRIYVSRGSAARRRLVNETDVLNLLKDRGFRTVVPDKLPVAGQARIFSEADVVVGVHGAGLTNLLFCKPGTRVVELFAPQYVIPCYYLLALEAGLDYRMLYGVALQNEPASGAADADVFVRVEELERALQ